MIPLDGEFHECAVAYWYPKLKNLTDGTNRRYADCYKRHVYPTFSKRDPRTIKHSELQTWANQITGTATPHLAAGIMVQIFKALIRQGIVHHNPAQGLSLPKKVRRTRAMSFADLQRLLMLVEGTELAAPVFLAACLGFRRGEVCGLKWEHVDTRTRRVALCSQRLIRHGAVKGKKIGETTPKRGSARSFVLPQPFMDILLRVGDLDSAYVATNNKKPWNPERLTGLWAERRTKLGFASWHFHDLRHGAAGILVDAGVDLLTIAAILGHKNLNVTQLYTSVREETASKGLEELAKRLFPLGR